MKSAGQLKYSPNYSRWIIWILIVQLVAVAVLFGSSEYLPSWTSWMLVAALVFVPLLAYLVILTRPPMRRAWRDVFRGSGAATVVMLGEIARVFHPTNAIKLARWIASLKPTPTTVDEWITLCVLPFKTSVVVTFPIIWLFEKILSHTEYFRPYGRVFGLSYELIFECYGISMLGLLLGALLQGIFCRSGRATTTLRYFLFGLILFAVLALAPRAISL